jgi:hypothetical protein
MAHWVLTAWRLVQLLSKLSKLEKSSTVIPNSFWYIWYCSDRARMAAIVATMESSSPTTSTGSPSGSMNTPVCRLPSIATCSSAMCVSV